MNAPSARSNPKLLLTVLTLTTLLLSCTTGTSGSGPPDDGSRDLVSVLLDPPITRLGIGGAWYPVRFVGVDRAGRIIAPLAGVKASSSDSSVAFIRNDSLYALRVGEVYLTLATTYREREVVSLWHLRTTTPLSPMLGID